MKNKIITWIITRCVHYEIRNHQVLIYSWQCLVDDNAAVENTNITMVKKKQFILEIPD